MILTLIIDMSQIEQWSSKSPEFPELYWVSRYFSIDNASLKSYNNNNNKFLFRQNRHRNVIYNKWSIK